MIEPKDRIERKKHEFIQPDRVLLEVLNYIWFPSFDWFEAISEAQQVHDKIKEVFLFSRCSFTTSLYEVKQ